MAGGRNGRFHIVGVCMDIYWGPNTTLRVMGVLHDDFTSIDLGYIYIFLHTHTCDLSSVGEDRGVGCMVMTYWPVDD